MSGCAVGRETRGWTDGGKEVREWVVCHSKLNSKLGSGAVREDGR